MGYIRGATLTLTAVVALACNAGSPAGQSSNAPGTVPIRNQVAGEVDRGAYEVFPDRDAGADPAVPADQGGRGFTGAGWETNTHFDLIGDPRSLKGGAVTHHILDFPATLRIRGPESNTELNYMIQPLVWETLLTLDPMTSAWMPTLATHWQISPDRTTYRFRIDPNARFSDRQPVTADVWSPLGHC